MLKNWNELDDTALYILEKYSDKPKVNQEFFSSPSEYENARDVEGGSKQRKYQGGDPRHADGNPDAKQTKSGPRETRSGEPRMHPDHGGGNMKGTTTRGRSGKAGPRLDYETREVPFRGGKPGQRKTWNW